jgi:arylsulfatase A-like enzyme
MEAAAHNTTNESRSRRARRGRFAALALVLAIAASACDRATDPGEAAGPGAPNVLLIVTDDQPFGTVKRMPKLSSAPGFIDFSSYYDNNPLCCPTRATLLTGLYSHHTGVEVNRDAPDFDPDSTLATWLDAAGYRTGLFGKYFNDYPWNRGRTYVPPGWDEWSAFTPDAAYYDYTLVHENSRKHYGDKPQDYSTDVLADQVDDFIRGSEDPFFAYFAPYGPHAPRTPAPRDAKAFKNTRVELPKNFNRIAKNAPRWWKQRKTLSTGEQRAAIKNQWRALQSVDDAIGRFLKTLEETGEADNTVVIFLSDNGYSLGSHRYPWKDCAYEECIHLPLMMRVPGLGAGQVDALAGSMDIAPTIAELAGATPTVPPDGRSLVPLLDGSQQTLDRSILLRHVHYQKVPPTFWGVRTERFTYVTYPATDEVELYDNEADPNQLRNLAGKPGHEATEAELEAELQQLRGG